MRSESIVFAVAGAFFGLIVGWILGSQTPRTAAPGPVAAAAAASVSSVAAQRQAPEVDEARERTLLAAAEQDPGDARARTELGNLYFDAERFDEASTWYEASLEIDPESANVSTDLGVSYYYTNQPDRALQQFQHSLEVDPRHTKTLLNLGIVRAFGTQDLDGASEAWRAVIEIAPDSPEALAARQALESLAKAHPGLVGEPDAGPAAGRGGGE